jgi:hypothetical protein
VDAWRVRPGHIDNHWLDCLVGSAVGASMQGAVLAGSGGDAKPRERRRVSFAELQRRSRAHVSLDLSPHRFATENPALSVEGYHIAVRGSVRDDGPPVSASKLKVVTGDSGSVTVRARCHQSRRPRLWCEI